MESILEIRQKQMSDEDTPVVEDYRKVHQALVADLWDVWKRHHCEPFTPEVYSKLSVVSLTHVASIIALDVKMTQDQYLKVCLSNFLDAQKKAPKWG